jgi:hypothetical protein
VKPHSLTRRDLLQRTALASAAMLACLQAHATDFDTGNPDLKIRWDNTVKYSAATRLPGRSPALSSTVFGSGGVVGANNVNQDDGDNNFDRGLVSNRLDLFSEADLSYANVGARVSGAAWYDAIYNRDTDNHTLTANHVPASEFPAETRKLMGRKAELLDAFVYGKFDIADRPVTARLGRHTLLWGESLFFGANGIAGGQAPIDLIKLLSVPNAQFKEIARPTGKLSGQIQLSSTLSVGAYLGYEWQKTRLIPAGAYLSASDTLGPGAERINAGALGSFQRAPDVNARDGGQGGIQVRWSVPDIDTDFGFYAIRYNPMTPANIVTQLVGIPPALTPQNYRWFYHEGTRAYGASFAKAIGEWSFAGEVSYRQNAPLASAVQTALPTIGVGTGWNNNGNPPYAVGESAHAQLSWIASLGPNFLATESSFVGEIAWNTRTKTTRNPAMLNPHSDKSATGLRMVYSPTYRQILSGLDLTPSAGVGYVWGSSSAVGPGFGVDKGGDINLGLSGVYLSTWIASLSYVRYVGPLAPALDNASIPQYTQALRDRDFLSMSIRTTF